MGPHSSSASSTSGHVAGHPERSRLAPADDYPDNVKRRARFEAEHEDVEIVRPDTSDRWPEWTARFRNEDIPAHARIIYRATDLGLLLDYLERLFEPGTPPG